MFPSRAEGHVDTATMGVPTQIVLALGVVYVAWTASAVYEMCRPPVCRGMNCYRPLLKKDDRLDLRVAVAGSEVWNATNVSADEVLDIKIELPVPPAVRRGEAEGLQVDVFLAVHGANAP